MRCLGLVLYWNDCFFVFTRSSACSCYHFLCLRLVLLARTTGIFLPLTNNPGRETREPLCAGFTMLRLPASRIHSVTWIGRGPPETAGQSGGTGCS